MTQISKQLEKYPLEEMENGNFDVDIYDIDFELFDIEGDGELFNQKLNYKCKREDSPDGSNKCPDDGKEIKEPKTKKVQLAILGKKLSYVTGAEIVKLDGLQPQDVSTVLNTIKEESQYGEIKLKRIDNTQGGVKSAAMAFTPVNGAFELHLPVKYLKSERERIVEDDADTLIEHMKKTIEHNETEIEKLRSTTKRMNWRGTIAKQKEILRDLIERKEAGKPYQPVLVSYHFKGDDRTKASTLHEIGHYRWYAELNDNDKNKLTEVFKKTSEDKYFPSKLSKQDNEEWMAEQYVMLRMGKECHPIIKEVFGKLTSKQNARGKCPLNSYEAGTFKCDPADSDTKEESSKPEKISKIEFETGGDGGSDGQYDGYIVARDPKTGKKMGYLDYSYLNGEYAIQMIETEKEYQRKGVATSLINELKKTFDKDDTLEMQGTFATEEGQAFMKSIGLGKDKFRKLDESDYNKLKEDAMNLDLDDNERKALQEYSLISSYMNSYLGGDPEYYNLTDEKLKEDIETKANDAVSGLQKSYLPFGIKTWRTVKSSIEDMMDEDSFKPGYVVFNPTILSTSFSRSKAFGYRKDPSGDKEKPLLMEVRLPKGSRAILQNGIDKASDNLGFKHAGEYEVMVSPGNFVVSSYEELPKIRKLVWQAIP